MADLFRLIVFAFMVTAAHAETIQATQTAPPGVACSPQYIGAATCWWKGGVYASSDPAYPGSGVYSQGGAASCPGGTPAAGTCYYLAPVHYPHTCPSGEGWTLNGTTCERPDCPSGTTRNPDGSCSVDCASKAGTKFSGYAVGSSPASVTQGGCAAMVVQADNQCKVGGQEAWCGTWEYTGDQGDPADSATEGAPDFQGCPAGKCAGEFNGSTICLACSGSAASTQISTEKTTDPATGETVVNMTTTTTNANTTTTTTTTITTDGQGTTTEEGPTTETDNASFCAKNPLDPKCIEGDTPDQLDMATLEKGTVDVSAGLNAQGWLGGGQCPQDEQIQLPHGGTLTIPFSELCPYLQIMGAALVLMAGVLSIRIVGVI